MPGAHRCIVSLGSIPHVPVNKFQSSGLVFLGLTKKNKLKQQIVSCLRTQHSDSDSDEARTSNPLIPQSEQLADRCDMLYPGSFELMSLAWGP